MKKSSFFFWPLIICMPVVFLSISSCASLGKSAGDEKDLTSAVQSFNFSVRWGEYKEASVWVIPQTRNYYWELSDWLVDNVRILDFEVRDVVFDEASNTGTSSVYYRFFYKDDPYIKTKTVEQKWRYEQSGKLWQVVQHNLESLVP
jgi:hypothetical protein